MEFEKKTVNVGELLAEYIESLNYGDTIHAQTIEEVTKEMRRNKKYIARGSVDDEYLTDLFSKITALFRLDQIETGSGSGKADLGPMPGASVALLAVLASAWVIIGTSALIRQMKEKKKSSDVH